MAKLTTRLDADNPGAEKVGYCSPPKKYRWSKGQSGNPSGKSKKRIRPAPPADDLASLVAHELLTSIEVLKGGKAHNLTKFEVVATKLVNQLLSSKTSKETIGLLNACEQLGVFAKVKSIIEETLIDLRGPWTPELEARFLEIEREVRGEWDDDKAENC